MTSNERRETKLERADLARGARAQSLHLQIGYRMRKVFLVPETNADEFDVLLKRISDILP